MPVSRTPPVQEHRDPYRSARTLTAANLVGVPLVPAVGLVATYNLITMGSGVLAAYAMFVYARRRTGDAGAAFVGGLLFGFNPFMTARASAHFSLIQVAPLPIFGLLMFRMFEAPTLRLAAGAGLVVAWAFLSDPYYAVYCLLILLFTVGYSLIAVERRPPPTQRTWWRMLIDLGLLCMSKVAKSNRPPHLPSAQAPTARRAALH